MFPRSGRHGLVSGRRKLKSKAFGVASSGTIFKRRTRLAVHVVRMEGKCIKILVRITRMSRLLGRIILK
jgi:hypothetical protein